jgi:hypothetical protein
VLHRHRNWSTREIDTRTLRCAAAKIGPGAKAGNGRAKSFVDECALAVSRIDGPRIPYEQVVLRSVPP